ncbi:MAG: OmpA family protein [Muribaculaceae bacterium]|nr:OmpA family protein [Muribaculaceae bacterium]
MKKSFILATAAIGSIFAASQANAQETVVVSEETVTVDQVNCKNHYYSSSGDNWFIQLGAGIRSPFVENELPDGGQKHHLTPTYNAAFGKWMSPYLGWRISMYYGSMHGANDAYSKAKTANANFDLMWDMFNTFHGVNTNRVFSIVPFVGLGGTFAWDFRAPDSKIVKEGNEYKHNSWTLPVSAGLQLRFRLCRYADFFLEGRASFYGDNFNLCAYGDPVDIDISAIGGFSFNIGGSDFKTYNRCADLAYISSLNNQVNSLRNDLAATATALATAESQLPCPDVAPVQETVVEQTNIIGPMMSTVRFSINSAEISNEEMVNVFNVAEYLKANPEVNVSIVGFADEDTGTATYNMELSQRRAQAVYNALTNTYGINADRLSVQAKGSNVQPYETNNWNRIVIFVPNN